MLHVSDLLAAIPLPVSESNDPASSARAGAEDLPDIHVSKTEIEAVLLNLVNNALEATEASHLEVEVAWKK